MTFPLHGAVAVVTGAASGIGAALALALAARGTALALVDVEIAALEQVADQARARGVRVSTHRLDVADRAAVAGLSAAVLAVHGRVSLLVNNAGIALGGTFEEVPEAAFDRLMAVNFDGTVAMTRAFLPVLRQEAAAHIVNLSSLFGLIAPPGQVPYCASKFAVRGFSEALRHELAGSPVTVTVVHPGGVRTGIAAHAAVYGRAAADRAAQAERWDKLLRLPPEAAAAAIVAAIERRAPRAVIGQDARAAALLQRLFPVGYWRLLARLAT